MFLLAYLFAEFSSIFSLQNFKSNIVSQSDNQHKVCHIHITLLNSLPCCIYLSYRIKHLKSRAKKQSDKKIYRIGTQNKLTWNVYFLLQVESVLDRIIEPDFLSKITDSILPSYRQKQPMPTKMTMTMVAPRFVNFFTSWKCRKRKMKSAPPKKASPRSHSVQGSFLNLSLVFEFSRISMSDISVWFYFWYNSTSSSLGDLRLPDFFSPRDLIPAATAPSLIIFFRSDLILFSLYSKKLYSNNL